MENNKAHLNLSQLKLKRVFVGGTAPPRAMIEQFRDLLGAFLLHAWGITETSPIVTIASLLAKHETANPDEIIDIQVKQERPLLLVQPKPGRTPSILDFLSSRIVKWWMPDEVVVVENLPHTATGKLLKSELRARYHGHLAVNS